MLAVVVQREVLGELELEDEAAPLPVLGNVTHARVERLARRRVGQVFAADADLASRGLAQTGQGVDQLALAVAVDAGDADDLARSDVERDAAHGLEAAVVRHVEVLDLQSGSPGCAGFLSTRRSTSRPTIARASPASVAPSRGIVSTFLPRRRTVMRSAISSTSFSL